MDSNRLLELALENLQRQVTVVDEEIAEIRREMTGTGANISQPAGSKRGRMRTATERKRHSEAMKKYWAAKWAQTGKKAAIVKQAAPAKAKAASARSEAMKKAWAKRKKAAEKTKTKS